jgi:Holliday junction resolvase RusA-like endonuclease
MPTAKPSLPSENAKVLAAPAFEIKIPFPIYPKSRPRFSTKTSGHPMLTYMPKEYTDCVNQIGLLMRSKMPIDWDIFAAQKITAGFYLEDPTQGDIDQLLGTVMDAGNKLIWYDDRQISDVFITRHILNPPKRMAIVGVHQMLPPTGFEASDATLKAALKAGVRDAAKELARRAAAKKKAKGV